MPIEIKWLLSVAHDHVVANTGVPIIPEINRAATEWLTAFNSWKNDNGMVYDMNSVHLSRRMMMHKFNAIVRKRTKHGSNIIMDAELLISQINKKYNIVDGEDEDDFNMVE